MDTVSLRSSSIGESLIDAYHTSEYQIEDTPVGTLILRPEEKSEPLESLFNYLALVGDARRAAFVRRSTH